MQKHDAARLSCDPTLATRRSVRSAIDGVHETPKARETRAMPKRRHKGNARSLGAAMETCKKQQLCDMHRSRRRGRVLVTALLVAAVLAGVVALAVYLVYRPLKPQASVARAAVYQLANAGNFSAPPYALAASMQFTLLLHNPSDRATVLYNGLLGYVTYRGELVTPSVQLPAVVQERGADVALSPLLGAGAAAPVPVSADAARALAADCVARRVQLRLVVIGQIRYKSGPFRTGWRDLYVRCDVTVGLGTDAAAGGVGAGDVPLLEYPQCFVDA